jgi:hypothetical protein
LLDGSIEDRRRKRRSLSPRREDKAMASRRKEELRLLKEAEATKIHKLRLAEAVTLNPVPGHSSCDLIMDFLKL